MKRSDFHFHLPEHLIAQFPEKNRSSSRLLNVDRHNKTFNDCQFIDIINLINPGDLLVFNNTKVIPARLYGNKKTGGKIELLIEKIISRNTVVSKIRASKSPQIESILTIGTDHKELPGFEVKVVGRSNDLFELEFLSFEEINSLLETYGHMPLPPYVKRADEEQDYDRYQTVYAKESGAVAAPTAGLHFDEPLLQRLSDKGVNSAYVTLHVGAGTYQPVRVDNITDHHMHSESIDINEQAVQQILATKKAGKRVIAVGTTSLRTLESAALFSNADKIISPYQGETDIFIYPGYEFKVIDALLTNFHLSESTLFMLVSALAGLETMKAAYKHAIKEQYRFFSYGDAMFIHS
ncbi:MAG: tRNA preQ1(34) S-adenosylmethionine ribosyltransferase-isomerase QueA [Gammaproteobacteria bacterium]|nr:tRNA preQ1(34) S-adenosylmethionine ribosyltransferase-isomerase QueA [Gammaproteobacteria bacterium]